MASGRNVGKLEGRLVGRLDVGDLDGGFVSPGCVGREVTGEKDGYEVGLLDVGIDVGAGT